MCFEHCAERCLCSYCQLFRGFKLVRYPTRCPDDRVLRRHIHSFPPQYIYTYIYKHITMAAMDVQCKANNTYLYEFMESAISSTVQTSLPILARRTGSPSGTGRCVWSSWFDRSTPPNPIRSDPIQLAVVQTVALVQT